MHPDARPRPSQCSHAAALSARFFLSVTGTISLKNLRRVAKELGENMTDDELQEVIDFCDKDGRGEISQDDFVRLMLAEAEKHSGPDSLHGRFMSPHDWVQQRGQR